MPPLASWSARSYRVGPEPCARSRVGIAVQLQRPGPHPGTGLRVHVRRCPIDSGGASRRSTQHAPREPGGEQLDGRGRDHRLVRIHAPEHPAGLIRDGDAPLAGRAARRRSRTTQPAGRRGRPPAGARATGALRGHRAAGSEQCGSQGQARGGTTERQSRQVQSHECDSWQRAKMWGGPAGYCGAGHEEAPQESLQPSTRCQA